MKALLVLFDEQDRIIYEHPLQVASMEDMLAALYLELFNNNRIHVRWKGAHHFHIVSVSDDAVPKPVTSKSKLNFIVNCRHYNLTPSETNVAWELRSGLSYKDIGQTLNCTSNTVNTHVTSIYDKLQVNNRHQALLKLKAEMQSV